MFAFFYRIATSFPCPSPLHSWLRERARIETINECDGALAVWERPWYAIDHRRATEALRRLWVRVESADELALEDKEALYTRIELAYTRGEPFPDDGHFSKPRLVVSR